MRIEFPAPFMSMFYLLQFGNIGEYDQTIVEIVQGMCYEGYGFIHFCSMPIPTMLVEVNVRMGYAFKRINEGHAIKDSIPVSLNREKHPKLATMLFLGHSAATAVNAEKVTFTENPYGNQLRSVDCFYEVFIFSAEMGSHGETCDESCLCDMKDI